MIVFSRGDNLVTVNSDGTEETQLTRFDAVKEHAIQPTFTPDGTGILFTFVRGQFGVDDVQNAAFVDLDGSGLTPLGGAIHMTDVRIQPEQTLVVGHQMTTRASRLGVLATLALTWWRAGGLRRRVAGLTEWAVCG